MTAGLAFLAAALAALAAADAGRAVLVRLPVAGAATAALVDSVVRLGREGRDPGAADRRRLLIAAAAVALAAGTFLAGPLAGLILAAAGPTALARLLRARRDHYRQSVERGAPAAATAIADAIGGGHSLRGALGEAAASVDGAAGHELRRLAAELEAGARTDRALEALRGRVRSDQINAIVAACLLQSRAGGDLARLLRDCARSFEEQARLEGDLRTATAQARFTGVLVVLLPLGGGLLAELASPGWFAGLWQSLLTAWLVGLALVLQLAAAFLIRRLGRVRL